MDATQADATFEFERTYSRMTVDELLNLALDEGSLTPPAKSALKAELAKRKLGSADIAKQAQGFQRQRVKEKRRRPLVWSFRGCGTEIYGKRNPRPDGSYLGTKWIVFFWIPLVPLKSFRLKFVGERYQWFSIWSARYHVLAEYPPDVRQVGSTYSFMAAFLLGAWILHTFHAGRIIVWSAFAVWACTPWLLRSAHDYRWGSE